MKTRKTEALIERESGNHGRAKHIRAWTINDTTGFAWLLALVSISSCLRLTAMLTAHSAEHTAP